MPDIKPQLHADDKFITIAKHFRKHGDNGEELKQRLCDLGHESEAVLVGRLQRLHRPLNRTRTADVKTWWDVLSSRDPAQQRIGWAIEAIPDEPVDAVALLDKLGALRIDTHFQCQWAACTLVVTKDGWKVDQIVRRGRRWHLEPPELLRGVYLLHWEDHKDLHCDWQRHMHRMRTIAQTENTKKVAEQLHKSNIAAIPLVIRDLGLTPDKMEAKQEVLHTLPHFQF